MQRTRATIAGFAVGDRNGAGDRAGDRAGNSAHGLRCIQAAVNEAHLVQFTDTINFLNSIDVNNDTMRTFDTWHSLLLSAPISVADRVRQCEHAMAATAKMSHPSDMVYAMLSLARAFYEHMHEYAGPLAPDLRNSLYTAAYKLDDDRMFTWLIDKHPMPHMEAQIPLMEFIDAADCLSVLISRGYIWDGRPIKSGTRVHKMAKIHNLKRAREQAKRARVRSAW